MGFLKKIFGGGNSIDGLRKAVAQQRYVDARYLAEQLSGQVLEPDEAAEVEELRMAAGDGLARLNLDEALGLQSSGDFSRAMEHLQLAQEQVCSSGLREDIEQAISAKPLEPEIDAAEPDRATSCAACATPSTRVIADEDAWFGDAESQLELVLASYPAALAPRYGSKGEAFKDAFLLSHAGQDDQALPLWLQVDLADQDDLYWFELGALYARKGELTQARSMLESALEQNPELLLAIEALVPVLVATGDYSLAEDRLQKFFTARHRFVFLLRTVNPPLCSTAAASGCSRLRTQSS